MAKQIKGNEIIEDNHLANAIKQAEELLAAYTYFKPQKISILTYSNNPRISILDISKWLGKYDLKLAFFNIERKKLTKKKIH